MGCEPPSALKDCAASPSDGRRRLRSAHAWSAALILGVALAGHQAFSTNIFAMSADIFPPAVMGSAIGVASTTGTLGGMGILALAGWSLDHSHGYGPMFLSCTLGYPAALAWIHLMLPVIRPWSGSTPAEAATP